MVGGGWYMVGGGEEVRLYNFESINFTIPFLLAFAKTLLLLVATLKFYHKSFLVHLSGLILN